MVEPVSAITFVIQYGPWGVVVALLYFFVQLIRTGELVPKAQYKLVEDAMHQWQATAQKWQDIALTGSMTAKDGSDALKGVVRNIQDLEQIKAILLAHNPNQPPFPGGTPDKKP